MYLDRLYPYLKEKNVQKLSIEDRKTLITKIKALVIHKIGDVSVHQTDNIIVSAFVSTRMVGLLSNYNLLISTVSGCINVLFNSVTGSLGNMVATESKEYQYSIFKKYRFIGFWFYGFTAIALAILMTPFITLWIGDKMVVNAPDKYVALLQAVVNLVASIGLVSVIGLPGVYVGTIIQGTLSTVLKPILSYKVLFGLSSRYYFIDSAKYGIAVIAAYGICLVLKNLIMPNVTIMNFIIMMVVVTIIPNLLFFIVFHKTEEFRFVNGIVQNIIKRHKGK